MKRLLITLLLLSCFLQISCITETVNNTATTNPVDVYVAGSKNNLACYWENNQLVMLDSGNILASHAIKIIVSNGDVYVLGKSVSNATSIYLFWKNGVLTNLNSALNAPFLDINDFDVVGNDVYIVGYANNIQTNDYNFGYWKNGIRTILNNNAPDYNPSYIRVLNNDVYTTINFPTQGYYINTTYFDTPNKTYNGLTNNGNEMYVYGGFSNFGFYFNTSTNTNTNIGFQNDGTISGMCFDNNNLYYTNGFAIYKNGSTFTPETPSHFITDFKVLNDNVYFINTVLGSPNENVVINNQVVMGNNTTDEVYSSLYVVQN